ncbi:hypothetical protein CsSME_00043356 [Camellia sinensis var. sinensis]
MKLKPTPNNGIDRFKQQFTNLEEHYGKGERSTPLRRQYTSLPRERVCAPKDESSDEDSEFEKRATDYIARTSFQSPTRSRRSNKPENAEKAVVAIISASKCVGLKGRDFEETVTEQNGNVSQTSFEWRWVGSCLENPSL